MESSPASSRSPAAAPGVIVPYQMHVSQKYLDLTKKKLELTRLPRELQSFSRPDSGVAKADLERLVDHWTEEYSWRAQERFYNDNLPQYRLSIHGARVHFVHRRSMSANAMPLLFIHGWPESFITVSHMIDALCDPIRTPPLGYEDCPAFNVVAPSIPGFGFSDQVAEEGNNLATTAEMFDSLMRSLGYGRYMLHGSGWGFKIARQLALTHSESCIGIHTANLEQLAPSYDVQMSAPLSPSVNVPRTDRPQTVSYALCDSPTGLLAYIVDAIRPSQQSSPPQPNPWTPTTLINWTMLHWLPGPEVALHWLDNSTPMVQNLWASFSDIPLAISQYENPDAARPAPIWAEQFHRIALFRHRVGNVRFPSWERPAEMVQDIRDLARLLEPSYLTSYAMYAAGSAYDPTQYQ